MSNNKIFAARFAQQRRHLISSKQFNYKARDFVCEFESLKQSTAKSTINQPQRQTQLTTPPSVVAHPINNLNFLYSLNHPLNLTFTQLVFYSMIHSNFLVTE